MILFLCGFIVGGLVTITTLACVGSVIMAKRRDGSATADVREIVARN